MKVFIVGSGLIGACTAIALAQKTNWTIEILESKPMPPAESLSPQDTRTLALNYTSQQYLDHLGLWDALEPKASPIEQIHISEQGAFGSCRLTAEAGYPNLGTVIPIKILQEHLLNTIKTYPNIQLHYDTPVQELRPKTDHFELAFSPNQREKVPYVILADGTFSPLREQLHIACETFDYHQTAIVAQAYAEKPHEQWAYERFAGKYTLAVLPLPAGFIGTVLTCPSEEKEHWLAETDNAYLQKINTLLGYRLKNLTQLGPRQHYPLQLRLAQRVVVPTAEGAGAALLLGNTAHTINPIGAQGFNLGLRGLKDCVDTLVEKKDLNAFEKRHLARMHQLKTFTHRTASLFTQTAFPMVLGRRIALSLLEHLPTLKASFTRHMMGFDKVLALKEVIE